MLISRTLIPLALAAALLVAGLAASGVAAAEAKTCTFKNTQEYRELGPTYVFPYQVKGVGCRKGKKVIKAYHACRYAKPKGGLKGKCTNPVMGFNCDEGKREGIKGVQYDANVTCRRGDDRVRHHYQQSYELAPSRGALAPSRSGRAAQRPHGHRTKSAASRSSTRSAATAAPAGVRCSPSDSRTTCSRPSTSIESR